MVTKFGIQVLLYYGLCAIMHHFLVLLVHILWLFLRNCTGLGWDKDGDMLAMINDKNGVIMMWDANTGKTTPIDSGLR